MTVVGVHWDTAVSSLDVEFAQESASAELSDKLHSVVERGVLNGNFRNEVVNGEPLGG
jgi:hypothetical protein